MKSSDILLVIVAFVFPPAAAGFIAGWSWDLLLNVLLCIFGYFPGYLHAFWLIYKKMQAEEQYGMGGFQYLGHGRYEPSQVLPGPAAGPGNYSDVPAPNYGAVANNGAGH